MPSPTATAVPTEELAPTVTHTPSPTATTAEPTAEPTPTATPTPTSTATQPPALEGTSLTAEKTATGFWTESPEAELAGVEGQVCVLNNGGQATLDLTIFDIVQIKTGSDPFSDYVSNHVDLGTKPILQPGESHCYSYTITFVPREDVQYRNVARVTILNHSGWLPGSAHCPGEEPCPFGPEPKADFYLP
jgi:hypothetical protein